MATDVIHINVGEMIDLAVGSPEAGYVDFNMLQSVLHVLAQQQNLLHKGVELRGTAPSAQAKDNAKAHSVTVTEYTLQAKEGKPVDPDAKKTQDTMLVVQRISKAGQDEPSAKALEVHFNKQNAAEEVSLKDFQKLEGAVDKMKKQVYGGGGGQTGEQLLDHIRNNPGTTLITDMWTSLNVTTRIEALEEGLSKLSSLVQDLAVELAGVESREGAWMQAGGAGMQMPGGAGMQTYGGAGVQTAGGAGMQSSWGATMQSSEGATVQSSWGATMQSSEGAAGMQSSGGAAGMQSSGGAAGMQSSGGAAGMQSSGGAGQSGFGGAEGQTWTAGGPGQAGGAPGQEFGGPGQAAGAPGQGFGGPGQGFGGPGQGFGGPGQAGGAPGQGFGGPGQAGGAPGQGFGGPGQADGAPGQGFGGPGQAGGAPGQGFGGPGQAGGAPGQGFGGPGQAAGAPGQGFGGPGQAFGAPGQAFGAPGQAFGAAGQAFGAAGQAAGGIEQLWAELSRLKYTVQEICGLNADGSGKPVTTRELKTRLSALEKRLRECCDQIKKVDGVVSDQLSSFQDQLVGLGDDITSVNDNLASGNWSPDLSKDVQGLGDLLQLVMQLQQEVKGVRKLAESLTQEKEERGFDLKMLIEQVEVLKTIKMDREDMAEAMAEKADTRLLARKVSHDQFESTCDDLSRGLDNALSKMNTQESLWQNALDDIQREVETKLDKLELAPVKQFFTDKLAKLQENLRKMADLRREAEAAGTKKKFLRDVNCISCDARAIMAMTEDSMLPAPRAMHAQLSIKPYLTYELDQIRKQQANGPSQRNMRDWENIDSQSKQKPPERVRSTTGKHLCTRYCGGSHTVTTPAQRVARAGHFLKEWGPDVMSLSPTKESKAVKTETTSKIAVIKAAEDDAKKGPGFPGDCVCSDEAGDARG